MKKVKCKKVKCDYCKKEFFKKAKIRAHNFCSFAHFRAWNSKRVSEYNRTNNPANRSDFWTAGRRAKHRRIHAGKGQNRAYKKTYGRHTHRIVAEMMLERDLEPHEVVHHINGDISDNSFENIAVMTKAEHCSLHMKEYWAKKKSALSHSQLGEKGGDANHDSEE